MRIKKIDTQIEKRILIGAITSKRFLQEIDPFVDLAYFQNTYVQFVTGRCVDFFRQYDTAPYMEVRSCLYSNDKDSESIEIINKLVDNVLNQSKTQKTINVERLLDQTTEYFKKREIEITNGNIAILLEQNEIAEAERELLGFKKIARVTSSWQNPFDPKNIEKTFRQEDEVFFKFPGDLGNFLGNIKKGWLVGISGPFKRGKTWTQLEFAVMSMMMGRKVTFLSLEMSEEEMFERLYKRLVPYLKEGTISLYPCFDCGKNQSGLCRKKERVSKVALMTVPGVNALPDFYDAQKKGYLPCSECRFDDPKEYEQSTWFEEVKIPEFDQIEVIDKLAVFDDYYGNLIRVKAYPKFSANVADLERDLDILELTENFMSEVIIVDHADILKPENGASGVEKEDLTWISLARMAGERKALVVTGTQLNKASLDAAEITQKHTARWIGKLGHVDMMLSLNQTEEEKRLGVMRIGVMVHRHKDFYESDKVTLLQKVKLGQIHLDSII